MRKTFKYKARVNKNTEANFDRWLHLCRDLYNMALEQRITAYRYNHLHVSAYEQMKELPELKEAFPEYKDVNSQALQQVIQRLDLSYQAFFRRVKNGETPGFPRFKGRNRYDSFTLKQTGWRLDGRNLHVRNVGRFKLHLSRPVEGAIKTVTIRRAAGGSWYVCFSCDDVPEKGLPASDAQVGIDVGISSFLVDSEGRSVDNPMHLAGSLKKLARRQRSLSRKKKGSSHRIKARVRVAKTHEKVSNQRLDFLHKTANYYVRNYGTVFIEDLKIRNMVKNRHLSKSISDAGWGTLFELLSYKAEEAGRLIVRVAPHGTSQNCSGCGVKVPKDLSVRVHKCDACGLVMDRDLNAAINILRLGQSLQAPTPSLEDVA